MTFPVTDSGNRRVRRALAVSSEETAASDAVVAFISSVINEHRLQSGDYVLRRDSLGRFAYEPLPRPAVSGCRPVVRALPGCEPRKLADNTKGQRGR